MMIAGPLDVFSRGYRHLARLRGVGAVLARYGLDDLLHHHPSAAPGAAQAERAARLRRALEELGPTFVKAGQFLSMRCDLLPPAYLAELQKLQDAAPAFSFAQAREVVESELGAPLEKLFSRFSEKPFAAASLGQVHRARLKDGREAVVKVQRPGVRELAETDLDILRHLAAAVEKHQGPTAHRRLSRALEEWGRSLERELDYGIEAAQMDRFARQFHDDPKVLVPAPLRPLVTGRVLTMEWLRGTKASDLPALDSAGVDRRALAGLLVDQFVRQVLMHGFFHADLHPGNVLASGGGVGYLDFGQMGRVDARSRQDLVSMLLSLAGRDDAALTRTITSLSASPPPAQLRELEREVSEMIDRYAYGPLREIPYGKVLREILAVCSRYDLVFPEEVFLLAKALGSGEGLVRALDPDCEVVGRAAKAAAAIEAARRRPKAAARRLARESKEALSALWGLPAEAAAVLAEARRGRLKLEFEHLGLDPLRRAQDSASNRLAFAVVLGALIVGSSLMVLAGVPPLWRGVPVLGWAGFVMAAVMGFGLLWGILRHGRL